MLWPGEAIPDRVVKYLGTNNDRDAILSALVGNPTTSLNNQYNTLDVTLDGWLKYLGSNNDKDPILVTVGGGTPTATRSEQIP